MRQRSQCCIESGRGRVHLAVVLEPLAAEPRFVELAEVKQRVIVHIKDRVIVIFPNKEVEVGTMNPGDHLVVREVGGPNGRDWIAFIEAAGR